MNNNSEILFWSIYRNKFLNHQIFSNFEKFYDYNGLSKASFILTFSNGIEIIKDRLKSNRIIIIKDNDLNEIFQRVKEKNEVNFQFYIQIYRILFKKYATYSNLGQKTIKYNIENSVMESTLNKSIEFSNLLALEAFIGAFDLDYGTARKALTNTMGNIIINNYNTIKIYKHLIKKYQIPTELSPSQNILHKNFLNFQYNPLYIINELKLKHLIKTTHFIIENKHLVKFKISLINYQNLITGPDSLKNQIESHYQYFTTDQLNSTVQHLLLQIPLPQKESPSVTSLLFFYLNMMTVCFESYNILSFYKEIKKIIFNNGSQQKLQQLSKPETEFEYYYNKGNEAEPSTFSNSLGYLFNKILDSEQYNRTKSIQVIYNLLKSGKKENIQIVDSLKIKHGPFIDSQLDREMFRDAFGSDLLLGSTITSIEVVDFYFQNYQDQVFRDNNSLWKYIVDIQVLEHFENYMLSLGRMFKVFGYTKAPVKNESEITIIDVTTVEWNQKFYLEKLLRALKRPNVYYIYESNIEINFYSDYLFEYFNSGCKEKQNTVINIFKETFKVKEQHENPSVFYIKSIMLLNKRNKLLNWIFDNYETSIRDIDGDGDFIIKLSYLDSNQKKEIPIKISALSLFLGLYYRGRYEDIMKLSESKCFYLDQDPLFYVQKIKECNLDFLIFLINQTISIRKNIDNNNNEEEKNDREILFYAIKEWIVHLLNIASVYYPEVLKYLQSKYTKDQVFGAIEED
ncbi:hypothetical protein DICPUDRAFT_159129 [Dictyostelium purpureum]|uniref:Uncharacterized protein n=1 Tax=Dictyostelium purpureum TaxID=5786 RepID=F1A3C5_DICPU|nr:uncharacterized protein DICPUDRAFT_159129 [Dictyostelium purpureum]EGC29305.1 hypothetical protein DICPUDRAFT_159129 [Dictyostelium purpureum]|eukprot:XP_003294173.1 hypothetical protein DICPUDRAFT_159129 [Dictyostelium purpureum]